MAAVSGCSNVCVCASRTLDFDRAEVAIRDGKGQKDRVTMLPRTLIEPLRTHLSRVRLLHERDLAEGYGRVYLPFALDRKYPNADRDWGWQYAFPASRRSIDPRARVERRHHASFAQCKNCSATVT